LYGNFAWKFCTFLDPNFHALIMQKQLNRQKDFQEMNEIRVRRTAKSKTVVYVCCRVGAAPEIRGGINSVRLPLRGQDCQTLNFGMFLGKNIVFNVVEGCVLKMIIRFVW
jgi:hypothetical protein